MPRVCTACAHPERDALDRALVRGEPKRQIAARLGLAESALGRNARPRLQALLMQREEARRAASADALLAETLAMQAKALDRVAESAPASSFRVEFVEPTTFVELARLASDADAADAPDLSKEVRGDPG